MKKLRLICILLIVVMTVGSIIGCSRKNTSRTLGEFETKIQLYPEPLIYHRSDVNSLASLRQYPSNRYDLRSYDISEIKLSSDIMSNCVFNSQTKWPDELPKFINLKQIIKYGENPGLNVRELHKKGITGKGINVGIIDGRLLVDHKEFQENVKLYEESFEMNGPAFYHSTPITSILVGNSNGIAPDVGVYYIAYLDENIDYEAGYLELAKAIQRLVDISRSLPQNEKLRVISISSGWDPSSENTKGIYEAIERAKEENIFVISARVFETHGLFFNGITRELIDNPDSIESYSYSKYINPFQQEPTDILLIPMDGRWLASSTGQEDYVMFSRGAWSMTIPYISGLYALACQVDANITPQEFWSIAISTGDVVEKSKNVVAYEGKNAKIVNPVKLIDAIALGVK